MHGQLPLSCVKQEPSKSPMALNKEMTFILQPEELEEQNTVPI